MEAYIGYGGGEGWFGRIVFGSEEAVHGGCLVGWLSVVKSSRWTTNSVGVKIRVALLEYGVRCAGENQWYCGRRVDAWVFIWARE